MDANSFHAPFADSIDISSLDAGHRACGARGDRRL
jgi:hypothetical protein